MNRYEALRIIQESGLIAEKMTEEEKKAKRKERRLARKAAEEEEQKRIEAEKERYRTDPEYRANKIAQRLSDFTIDKSYKGLYNDPYITAEWAREIYDLGVRFYYSDYLIAEFYYDNVNIGYFDKRDGTFYLWTKLANVAEEGEKPRYSPDYSFPSSTRPRIDTGSPEEMGREVYEIIKDDCIPEVKRVRREEQAKSSEVPETTED
jgi:hypothetical protein